MAKKTTGPKRRPAAERYQQIIDASTRVFYERGYADASIQEIADEVGILKGSLYYYINSKDDLLFEILAKVHQDVDAILKDIQAFEEEPPLARLREYVYRLVVYNLRNLPSITIYYHEIDRLQSEQRAQILERRRAHEVAVSDLIIQAQNAGDCDPTQDARLVRNFIFGALIWVYRWFRPNGRASDEDVADACADFIICGVTGQATGRRGMKGSDPWQSPLMVTARQS